MLLGTLYPLLIDALGMGKLSVGPPYFNAVFVPVMVPLLLLMAVGPLANWKHADLKAIARRLRVSMVLAVIAGIALPLTMGAWTPLTALSSLLAVWITASGVFQIMDRLKTGRPPAAFWGMQVAHFGIAVFVFGVAMVGGYQEEKDVRMEPGDSVKVGGYSFRLLGVKEAPGPNYRASVGTVELSKDGRVLKMMYPEKRKYFSSADADDRSRDRCRFHARCVCLARRAVGQQGGVERAGLLQTLRGLDLGRLSADGPGRRHCHARPALPAAGKSRRWRHGGSRGMKRFLIPLAVFVVLVIFLAMGLTLNPRDVPSPLKDKPAPAFTLPQLAAADRNFSPADMKGQVWLLNVWASWCVSCRQEHPLLVSFAKEGKVPVVGLNYKDQPADAKNWLVKFGDPYLLSAVDADGRVGINYGVYGVPETYVIDKAGMIRMKHTGPITPESLQKQILPLVAELSK